MSLWRELLTSLNKIAKKICLVNSLNHELNLFNIAFTFIIHWKIKVILYVREISP